MNKLKKRQQGKALAVVRKTSEQCLKLTKMKLKEQSEFHIVPPSAIARFHMVMELRGLSNTPVEYFKSDGSGRLDKRRVKRFTRLKRARLIPQIIGRGMRTVKPITIDFKCNDKMSEELDKIRKSMQVPNKIL